MTRTEEVALENLVGSSCPGCHTVFFPPRQACAHCRTDDPPRDVVLSGRGKLYSATTLHVGRDAPKTLGYVDLEDGPRVLVTFEELPRPVADLVTEQPDVLVHLRRADDGRVAVVGSVPEHTPT